MAYGSRTHELGCLRVAVSVDVLQSFIDGLLRVEDDSLPEWTCLPPSPDVSVPLCQADVLAAAERVDLQDLYDRLARVVELRGRRRLSPSSNRLVRDLLTHSAAALSACTNLMRILDETGFREGDRNRDIEARENVDRLHSLLGKMTDQYDATPLLLMAALVGGGFSCTLAAMLHGRDIAELARRGTLFYEVLALIRIASRLPDLALLLATPTRHHGSYVSVLGCLSALATSSRVLTEWGRPSGRTGGADTADRQRMAKKLLDTYSLLQAKVDSLSSRSTAAASAAAPLPAEADRLARIASELRAAQAASGAAAEASPSSYGMSAMTAQIQQPGSQPWLADMTAAYGGRAVQNPYGTADGSYGRISAPPVGLVPSEQQLQRDDVYGIASGGAAAQYAVETLRQQRELQRLRSAGAAGGTGSYMRDGLAHQSQPVGLTSPHDPMVTSTMSYPWGPQPTQDAAAAAAGTRQQLLLQPEQQQQGSSMYVLQAVSGNGPVPQSNGAGAGAGTAAATGAAAGTAGRHQRMYSVPSTPQAPSSAQYGPYMQQQLLQLHEQQRQRQVEQEQEQRQVLQRLEALSERLQQHLVGSATALPSYGKHLGGYTVSGTPAAPAVPNGDVTAAAGAAARPGSAPRQRTPSSDSSFYNGIGATSTSGFSSGAAGGGGSILGTGLWGGGSSILGSSTGPSADPVRYPAWPETPTPTPTQLRPGGSDPATTWSRQQQQQQSSARPAAGTVSGPAGRDPWQYVDLAAAAAAPGDAGGTVSPGAAAAAAAAATRPGSVTRARTLATEAAGGRGGGGAPAPWSPSGRVATAWPWEAESTSRTHQGTAAGGPAGRAPSTSRTVTHGSTSRTVTHGSTHSRGRPASHRSPDDDGSSSSSSSSSGLDRSPRGRGVSSGGGGGGTLRALAADAGLIPGLSRSPRQQQQQFVELGYEAQAPAPRLASAPRTGQQPSAPAPAATSGSFLERYTTLDRRGAAAAAGDPRVGSSTTTSGAASGVGGGGGRTGAAFLEHSPATAAAVSTATRDASTNTSIALGTVPVTAAPSRSSRYGSLGGTGATSSPSAGAYSAATAVAAPATSAGISSSSNGSTSAAVQRSGWDGSTAAAATAAPSQRDQTSGRNVGGSGSSGAASAAAVQRAASPYRTFNGDGPGPPPASSLPRHVSPSAISAAGQTLQGAAGATAVTSGRPMDMATAQHAAAVGDDGAMAAASTLGRRRRRMGPAPLNPDRYSSDGGAYDDDLQQALYLSRLEADAEAHAAAARAATNAATAAVIAATTPITQPGSTRTAAAGAAAAAGGGAGERSLLSSGGTGSGAGQPQPQPPAGRSVARLSTGGIDEGGGGGNLVGAIVPLNALHQRYAELNPLLTAKLVSLEDDFPFTRRVAGDGNCFYRAALFALLEHIMTAPDDALSKRLESVVEDFVRRLEALQEEEVQEGGAQAGSRGRGVGSRGATPERGARGATPERTRVDASPSPSHSRHSTTPSRRLSVDPAAVRGGRRLLRLLRTAWFKDVDTVEPSDVSHLEALFNHSLHSGEVIRFVRSLTVQELVSDEAFYAPFIPGCGRDYAGLTLRQICAHHVLPMGVEVEQLQIIAMCRALQVTVAVLDVAGSQVGAIKHGPEGHGGPPVAWVAHLPGHYDVVYPAKPLDVAPGGALVPVG